MFVAFVHSLKFMSDCWSDLQGNIPASGGRPFVDHLEEAGLLPRVLILPASGTRRTLPTGSISSKSLRNKGNVTHLCRTEVFAPKSHRSLRPKFSQDSLLCTKFPGIGTVGRKDSPAGFPSPQNTKFFWLEFLQSLQPYKTICFKRGRQIAARSREERNHVLFLQLLVIPSALIFAMLFMAKILEITYQKEDD